MRAEVEFTVDDDDVGEVVNGLEVMEVGAVAGLSAAASVCVCVCIQSGTWIETSTNGSIADFSMISRPDASLSRGNC